MTKNSNKPKFISFEGMDGSGKSTQVCMLQQYLLSQNIDVTATREIGGTDVGEEIRKIVTTHEISTISELMLVMAARYEHVHKVIIPALLAGKWVICDRFVDSTASYQSGDSGLSITDIYELHNKLITISDNHQLEAIAKLGINQDLFLDGFIMPSVTFLMDIDPEMAYDRASSRVDVSKFDVRNVEFYKKIRNRYEMISLLHSDRIKVISCDNKSVEQIHAEIVKLLQFV